MKKMAWLFSGQGSQVEGMGRDLYETYEEARLIYGFLSEDLRRLSFEGVLADISRTKNLQPIIVALQLAIWKVLDSKGIVPDAVCGLSLGEYSALVSAGAFSPKEALELIVIRGAAMERAAAQLESGMCAVLGSSEELILPVVERASSETGKVYISNINSSKQIVLSGEKQAVDRAQTSLKGMGARVLPLNVSGPFHTPYMEEAIPALREGLSKIEWKELQVPYYSNVSGEKYRGENLSEMLCRQMVSPVRLYSCLKHMVSDGIEVFVEIGSGTVLSSILRKEFPQVETYAIQGAESLEKFLEREA